MNDLALSNNLNQIELEINHHKQIAGQSIWEIGRRLSHVKDNDLTHGEFRKWHESIGINKDFASQAMKISKELPNVDTLRHLGTKALYLISTLPEEEREKEHTLESGETKKVDEMTVRELEEVKRKNTELERQVEQARRSEQDAIERLEEEKSKKAYVVEKDVVKEVKVNVTPPDYHSLKSDNEQLSNALKEQQEENQKMRNQINQWQAEQGELDKKSKRYDELSQAIQDMEGRMDTQQKRIAAVKDITSKLKAGNQLIDELSGLIYLADYEEVSRNDFLSAEINKLIHRLTSFTHDLSNRLDHSTILEGEIIND